MCMTLRRDLAGEFAGGEGCRSASPAGDPRYQTQLERKQCKVMGRLMGGEYHQRIIALKTTTEPQKWRREEEASAEIVYTVENN